MVAVSLALFIFDEIMRPSVTTYVSEGPRITLRYIRNGFFRYSLESLVFQWRWLVKFVRELTTVNISQLHLPLESCCTH